MKTARIIFSVALVSGVAAYACAADGASTAATPTGTEAAQLDSAPIKTLLNSGETATDRQGKMKYATAIGHKSPTNQQEVNQLLDFIDAHGKYSDEDVIRDSARNSLNKITDPALGPEFAKRVKKGQFRTRLASIEMVSKLKTKDAVPDLVDMVKGYSKLKEKLEGHDTILRLEATSALGEIGDERAIPTLLGQLGKMNGRESKALSKFGGKALPKLLEVVSTSKDAEEKKAAGAAISQMTDKALVPQLWKVFRDSNNKAGYALDMVSETADDTTSPTSKEVMDYVMQNAGKSSGLQASAIIIANKRKDAAYLIKAFQNTAISQGWRAEAISMLGELKDASAVPALTEALNDPNKEIRFVAALALKRITGKEYSVK